MTRAVIVSTTSQLLFDYWMKNFETWKHKVDKLYIADGRAELHYPKNVEEHIRNCKEDLMLIMHDDVFIYEPDILDEYFEVAKTKVASPIQASHATHEWIENALKEKFGNTWSFFPYFIFVSKKNILKTSVSFGEYKTDMCPILEVPVGADQGFLLSIELRNTGTEIHPIERYLAHEFPTDPPWVHAQGLSYNLLEYNISVDEYKLAWLTKIAGLDINKVKEKYDRLQFC